MSSRCDRWLVLMLEFHLKFSFCRETNKRIHSNAYVFLFFLTLHLNTSWLHSDPAWNTSRHYNISPHFLCKVAPLSTLDNGGGGRVSRSSLGELSFASLETVKGFWVRNLRHGADALGRGGCVSLLANDYFECIGFLLIFCFGKT